MKSSNAVAVSPRNYEKPLGKRMLNCWQLYLFLLIPIAQIIIFKYWPMAGIQIAFKNYDYRLGIWDSPWAGIKYFQQFFQSYMSKRVIINTLRLSIYNLIAGFPIPIVFALLLNVVSNKRYKKLVQSVTYMPHFISTVVLVGILTQMLNVHTGLYGHAYQLFHNGEKAKDILGIAKAFPDLYVWSGIWQSFGFNSIIYVASLSSVDASLHEAAEIDGANRFQRVLHVDLPAILPTISIMLILAFGNIMSVGYEKAYLMQNTLNTSYSEIISTYVYKVGIQNGGGNFSFGTAIGLFNSVVNFILLFAVNFITNKMGGASLW